jgi:hypothetical protein
MRLANCRVLSSTFVLARGVWPAHCDIEYTNRLTNYVRAVLKKYNQVLCGKIDGGDACLQM